MDDSAPRTATLPMTPPADDPGARWFELTPLQKGLLAESLVALDRGANVEQIVWELDGVPDVERFRAAWQAALDDFDALRLVFSWPEAGAEPRQSVLPTIPLPFRRLDGPECSPEQQQASLERFLEEDRRAGFTLSSPPLMRVTLLVFGQARAVCVWTIHHTIIDGNCYAAVLQRVLDAAAAPGGRAPAAAGPPPRFTDFLRWLERHDTAAGARHFAELLEGFDAPTPLPLRGDGARTAQNRSAQIGLRLEGPAAERLRAVARDTASTPNTLVQLAWALLLSRYSGEDDVLFGATWSGRAATLEDAAHVVGPLINTLPVRVRLRESPTVRDLIGALRRQHVAMRPFQQTPLGKIKAGSALAGSAHLFETIVVFENRRFHSVLQASDGRWRGHRLWSRSQTNMPLVLAAYFHDEDLAVELEYDVGLYSEATARRLLSDYGRLLAGLGECLDRSPFEAPMLDPAIQARLTAEEVAREVTPARPSAIERILERAAQAPGATAMRDLDGGEIGYAALAHRVRQLAGVLHARGVAPGVLVGVMLPRSIDAFVSFLAVHAAGGAVVPLDPADPDQRLEFMLRDSGARLVLVNRLTRGRLRGLRGLELDLDDAAVRGAAEATGTAAAPAAASPAYVIFTSGSTGTPKGVCVSHGALANHLAAALELFALRPQDRVLQFAALTFDVCLEELLPTLAAGATLVLRNEEVTRSARGFFEAVRAEGLSVLNLPTAFWHQLVRAEHLGWPACVRLVVVGGEQVSAEALRRFRASGTGHIRWLNAYGPTESTITSTCYDDAEGDHTAEVVPIGRPLPGISHFVLDQHLRLTPPGQPGQLYIGGAGLALGYLNRAEITRERFVEHPFREGARLYATGDRVRRTDGGNYVYLDRLDNQVKVRGFRVELGEIEARLRQHPAVTEAAVVLRERGVEDGAPVAFVLADRASVSVAQLREHLAAGLPGYMVPARLVIVERLPTLPSGKIDRRRLAELDAPAPGASEPSATVEDPLVRSLLQIWTRLLGRPVTDPAASFFDLGGDSLLVVQMFTEIEACHGSTCDAPAFFRNPTASNLATLLRTAPPVDWSAPVLELAAGAPRVRPLFLASSVSGQGIDYVHLAAALPSDIPVYALQVRSARDDHPGRETLREVAARLARRMREVQPRGPYAVAGFSAGGIVAMAIAQELWDVGERTDFVGLIDSVPPKSVPVPSPFSSPRRFARLIRTVAGRVREILGGPGGLARLWERSGNAVLRGLARWRLLPNGYDPTVDEYSADLEAMWSDEEKLRRRETFEVIWNHEFRVLPIDVVLFRVALDPFEGPHEPELGWQRVTSGTITVQPLQGRHERLLTSECARSLAMCLEPYLTPRVASSGSGVVGPTGAPP